MRCPYCKYDVDDAAVLKAAASIQGKRSKRKLSREAARKMQAASVAARVNNKGKK